MTILAATVTGLAVSEPFVSVSHAASEVVFASPQVAYDQGVGAMRAGKLDLAVVAFEFAAEQNHVPALYFLGTIYANNDERLTDHAKAFGVFHRIVERHAYVDPVSDYRSVYVVRAAVRLADYYRSGVPALHLKPDPRAAVELLNHAATYFGDLEAQFQLAKMHLTGEGVEGNERYGLHWLSRLAHRNHAGAQAFLAELMWRGKFVHKDPNQALVWSTLSVEGASDHDRIWIEEVYQTIYCGAPAGVRERAGQLVADWRRRAPSAPGAESPVARGAITVKDRFEPAAGPGTRSASSSGPAAVRTCANGEAVPPVTGLDPGPADRRDELATGALPVPAPLPVIDKERTRKGATSGPPATAGVRSPEPEPDAPDAAASPESANAGNSRGRAAPAFGEGFTDFGTSLGRRQR